jgi:hypothetical protein
VLKEEAFLIGCHHILMPLAGKRFLAPTALSHDRSGVSIGIEAID